MQLRTSDHDRKAGHFPSGGLVVVRIAWILYITDRFVPKIVSNWVKLRVPGAKLRLSRLQEILYDVTISVYRLGKWDLSCHRTCATDTPKLPEKLLAVVRRLEMSRQAGTS
jgi:hypothetical protein